MQNTGTYLCSCLVPYCFIVAFMGYVCRHVNWHVHNVRTQTITYSVAVS